MVRDAYIVTGTSRTARVRMMNGGQVCLCPDFVYVPADRCHEFVDDVERQFRHSFPTVLGNPEYCTIVDDRNYEWIVGLVEDARQGCHRHRGGAAGGNAAVGRGAPYRADHPHRGDRR